MKVNDEDLPDDWFSHLERPKKFHYVLYPEGKVHRKVEDFLSISKMEIKPDNPNDVRLALAAVDSLKREVYDIATYHSTRTEVVVYITSIERSERIIRKCLKSIPATITVQEGAGRWLLQRKTLT